MEGVSMVLQRAVPWVDPSAVMRVVSMAVPRAVAWVDPSALRVIQLAGKRAGPRVGPMVVVMAGCLEKTCLANW